MGSSDLEVQNKSGATLASNIETVEIDMAPTELLAALERARITCEVEKVCIDPAAFTAVEAAKFWKVDAKTARAKLIDNPKFKRVEIMRETTNGRTRRTDAYLQIED